MIYPFLLGPTQLIGVKVFYKKSQQNEGWKS